METQIFVEIIGATVVVLGGVFALIKYMVSQANKRERSLLKHNEAREKQLLEYFEKKNGHIERISRRFNDTVKENTNTLSELATEIKLLNK